MEKRKKYHHGDLRVALLRSAESVLTETGVESFSLRQVAKHVGVSHSAPAHHFGDANGLLTALAADGFRRFLAAMKSRQSAVGEDAREQILASGLGYLDFATESPALFRLMFGSQRVSAPSEELASAANASFNHLAADLARLRGRTHEADPDVMADVMAVWSMVHGFTELLISGRMAPVQSMTQEDREAFFAKVFLRTLA